MVEEVVDHASQVGFVYPEVLVAPWKVERSRASYDASVEGVSEHHEIADAAANESQGGAVVIRHHAPQVEVGLRDLDKADAFAHVIRRACEAHLAHRGRVSCGAGKRWLALRSILA